MLSYRLEPGSQPIHLDEDDVSALFDGTPEVYYIDGKLPLLMYKQLDTWKSKYTLNLATWRPTKGSECQTLPSETLSAKYMKQNRRSQMTHTPGGRYCVLDIETTGLPITQGFDAYHPPYHFEMYDPSRMIQLSWLMYDESGAELKSVMRVVKPDGFEILNGEFHGVTPERAQETGVPVGDVLVELADALRECDAIVGHNAAFDVAIIRSEMCRAGDFIGEERLAKMPVRCTMKMGKTFLGGTKYPKLKDLYKEMFGEEPQLQHDAEADARASAMCFFKMVN